MNDVGAGCFVKIDSDLDDRKPNGGWPNKRLRIDRRRTLRLKCHVAVGFHLAKPVSSSSSAGMRPHSHDIIGARILMWKP